MAAMDFPTSMPDISAPETSDSDPFNVTPRPNKSPHRYSSFDPTLSSAYATASPAQAKRALEAHLLDTDRRIRDASRLGTSLLEQKKALADRLKDVELQQGSTEINPELKQKLQDLEKEYNELGRESARAFIPKTRLNGGTLTVGDGETFDNMPTPSKSAAPAQTASRKNRNASSRVEDLAFATEISTSLLGQVRHLQNVLAEKEEALRKANSDNAKREADARQTHLRLKSLDDNEQRYKDENWHLETQVQELAAQLKDAVSRETKLGNALNAVHVDKATTERELDEIRVSHNKLADDHAALSKKHDAETSTLRRNMTSADSDRESLQRKLAEVTAQNEELARAVAYRLRTEGGSQSRDLAEDDSELQDDSFMLDPSPPPSPTKGTPRHGALESETLKSSLHHAHRMIQNLKNNIHREKTEKLELKRMLQDARDEVESRRADGGMSANAGKKRKPASQVDGFKKPARPDKLGSRSVATEEVINDPSWEEYEDSPSRDKAHRRLDSVGFSSDAFETANEADSTDAFETAGSVVGDDTEGDQTETEETTTKQRPSRLSQVRPGNRNSFLSTASSDGEDMFDLKTPVRSDQPRYKLKMGRGGLQRSSMTPGAKDSPASFISNSSQATPKQDLAAELQDLDDASIVESTPSRSIYSPVASPDDERKRDTVIRSPIPVARPVMVDSGTLTDPWEPSNTSSISTVAAAGAGALAGATTAVAGSLGLAKASHLNEQTATGQSQAVEPSRTGDASSTRRTSPWSFSGLAKQLLPGQKTDGTLTPNPPGSFLSVSDTSEEAPTATKMDFSPISVQSTAPVASSRAQQVFAIPPSAALTSATTGTRSIHDTTDARPAPALSNMSFNQSNPTAATLSPKAAKSQISDDVFRDESADRTLNNSPSAKENAEAGRTIVPAAALDERRQPFQQVSGNASPRKQSLSRPTKAEGTQTMVSAQEIDSLMRDKSRATSPTYMFPTPSKPGSSGGRTMANAEPMPPPNFALPKSPVRPGSGGRKGTITPPPPTMALPPLPNDHKQAIAAASRTSSLTGANPPPVMTPAAYKGPAQRQSRTPSGTYVRAPSPAQAGNLTSPRKAPSIAPSVAGSVRTVTRQTSISSFASEIEERFNAGRPPYFAEGAFEMPSTDPRMIQAITQTMIGEFMWKYTRKAGRGQHSENRHRRFFWIHPYTRTLYWSTQDPTHKNRSELKAKSVPIEAVRVVTDDNPLPPGLHPKSIIVVTPGRNIKFTAPTSLRHETWFNALSYLLLRNNPQRANDATDQAAVYQSMRSGRETPSVRGGSVRGSATNLAAQNYAYASPARHDRSTNLASLTNEEISEFNPTLHRSRASIRDSHSGRNSAARGRSITNFAGADRSASSLSGRLSVPQLAAGSQSTRSLTTRPPVAPSGASNSATASTTSTSRHTPTSSTTTAGPSRTSLDNDGFRIPAVPASRQQQPQQAQQGPAMGRPGSLSSRSRAAVGSLFTRSRSRTSLGGAVDAKRSFETVGSAGTAVAQDGQPRITVENVRACCDGRHDVGDLSHRSRHLSLSNRHSHAHH